MLAALADWKAWTNPDPGFCCAPSSSRPLSWRQSSTRSYMQQFVAGVGRPYSDWCCQADCVFPVDNIAGEGELYAPYSMPVLSCSATAGVSGLPLVRLAAVHKRMRYQRSASAVTATPLGWT